MQFLLNREGNISVFRVGVLFGILGIIGIGIGFLAFTLEVSNRQQPFNAPLYPNASELDRVQGGATSQTVRYIVSGVTAEEVAAFYQAELDKHLGQNPSTIGRQLCVRTPPAGNYQEYQPGNALLPYHFDCTFDNTFLSNVQITKVRIHPGVRDDANNVNFEGSVIISYDQRWSRP